MHEGPTDEKVNALRGRPHPTHVPAKPNNDEQSRSEKTALQAARRMMLFNVKASLFALIIIMDLELLLVTGRH